MKKTFVILALLVLIVSVVSAGSVFVDTGISFSTGSKRKVVDNVESDPISVTVVSLPFEIGYRQTVENDLVISASVAPYIPLSESLNGRASDEKIFPTCISTKVQGGYSMKINKEMRAEFLGGFSFAMGSRTTTTSVGNTKESFNTFSLVGEACIKYKLNNSFFLRAGAKVAVPFATTYKSKTTVGGSISAEGNGKYAGFMFNITPFVGGAYQF